MDESCPKCEAVLDHYPCPSVSYLIIWGQKKDDESTTKYRYINGLPHNHARFAAVSRTTALEDKNWKKSKKYRNLNTTASQAMVGKETADGFIGDAPLEAAGWTEIEHGIFHREYERKGSEEHSSVVDALIASMPKISVMQGLFDWDPVEFEQLHEKAAEKLLGKSSTDQFSPDRTIVLSAASSSHLERIMFDQSEKAGQAGNQQWGLDAGPHEDGWNPYIDDPFASEAKRQGSDSELQPGPGYDWEAEKKLGTKDLTKLQGPPPKPRKKQPRAKADKMPVKKEIKAPYSDNRKRGKEEHEEGAKRGGKRYKKGHVNDV
ncbi:hypothetical protein K435DRAFT_880024 [Dendrothele bispora CBS 962.96]|uniref:Uncharacterized protein n=1 Tax=Dendrothele bispora (strain CBS 962.96) TaxID=1314807 RepID=A0A4V4HAL8_DENBC|nr:hypothetical protein K435DRAFT_880024 [Dendrothele bispora CBS 962.96]